MTVLKHGEPIYAGKPQNLPDRVDRAEVKIIEGEQSEIRDPHGAGVIWLSDWLDRSLPKVDFLCGEWLTTTTRGLGDRTNRSR
jgi:hypothetical protein